MSWFLSFILIPLPFILLQIFLFIAGVYSRQKRPIAILFTVLTWIMFIVGVALVFYITPKAAIWLKFIIIAMAYMMGRLAFTGVAVLFGISK